MVNKDLYDILTDADETRNTIKTISLFLDDIELDDTEKSDKLYFF